MAKKSAGRLAGLAALAGAAYLASKGKEGKGDTSTAADREDAEMGAAMRNSMAATPKMSDMGEDERPAPTGMGAATEFAPRRAAAPRAPVARATGSGGGRGPAAGEEAAYKASRPAVSVGGSGGGRGPAAGEEAAYKAAGPRGSGMGSSITNRPDPRAPSIYAGKDAWAKYRAEQSGGKTTVDRQDAGAKRAGLNVEDYYESGKAQIDKQEGRFKRGGAVKKMASGGMTSSASKRADGIATKGKTRGKMC